MKWTDVQPSSPGWYWWRANADAFPSCHLIDRVGDKYGNAVLYCASCNHDHLEEDGGQWSDAPIPEPEEG
jgi:hypothetical protein